MEIKIGGESVPEEVPVTIVRGQRVVRTTVQETLRVLFRTHYDQGQRLFEVTNSEPELFFEVLEDEGEKEISFRPGVGELLELIRIKAATPGYRRDVVAAVDELIALLHGKTGLSRMN